MKKTSVIIHFLLLLNCSFLTDASAFVLQKTHSQPQIGTPQYNGLKTVTWRTKIVKKVVRRLMPLPNSAINLDKTTTHALTYSGLSVFSDILGFVLAKVTTSVFPLFCFALALIFSIISLIKARKVLINPNATKEQKKKAKDAEVTGILGLVSFFVLPILSLFGRRIW
jgi:hypothetical protein